MLKKRFKFQEVIGVEEKNMLEKGISDRWKEIVKKVEEEKEKKSIFLILYSIISSFAV